MSKSDSKVHSYLVAQLIVSVIGAIMLAVGDFGGFYYRASGVETTGYIFLGSGLLASLLVLTGIGGLLFAAYSALKSVQAKNPSAAFLGKNASNSVTGAAVTVVLAFLGALALALSSFEIEWWLDVGFFGSFFGGLLTIFFGKQILKEVK